MIREVDLHLPVIGQGVFIKPLIQYPLNGGVVIALEVGSPLACSNKPLPASLLVHAQDAHTTLISQLRVGFTVQHFFDKPADIRVYGSRPSQELPRTPFANKPVVRWQVFLKGGVAISLEVSFMKGDTLTIIQHRYLPVCGNHPDGFADVAIRNAVVMLILVKVDMTILPDFLITVLLALIALNR